jgi:Ser/Thr protein kinase RdoA (MazF antagonist)
LAVRTSIKTINWKLSPENKATMNIFPVTNSNLSAEHLAQFLTRQYSLGGDVNCMVLKCGINDTYLVTSSAGRSVFRVYSHNWRTIKEIEEEIRLARHLRDNNISISYALPDAKGNYIQEFNAPEGLRYGLMFSYAPGEKSQTCSPETHFSVGVVMANMHKAMEGFSLDRVSYTADNLLIDPLIQLSRFLPGDTEEMIYMQRLQQYLLNEFARVKRDELRYGAVHMDIWFDNLNIGKDNEITIFDLDFCGNGWLCLDIAYYILQLHSIEREEKVCAEKLNSFLRGYESVTSIGAEEKRIIPMLGLAMYFFYLGVQSRRYDNWSNMFFNEAYIKRFITVLIKRYAELNGIVV